MDEDLGQEAQSKIAWQNASCRKLNFSKILKIEHQIQVFFGKTT